MTRLGFVINLDTCSDHRSCMLACKKQTESFLGSHYIETFTAMTDDYPRPNTYFIPVPCQHCARPSCVPACPQGVFSKRVDGIVAVGDTSVCGSCQDKPCVAACPYQRIFLDPKDGRVGKCDGCAESIDAGGAPKCSTNCLGRSIMFGDLDDDETMVAQALMIYEEMGGMHRLRPELDNQPSVYYLLTGRYFQDMDTLYSPAWHNA
jgi:Fe-S-cluster-containing dehydrogenase component